MSSSHNDRKRAHDRAAQRASRAKNKAYIAQLEKTIQDLSQNSGDDRVNYLADQASKQSQEIENLQSLVNKIQTLVQDATRPKCSSLPQRQPLGSLREEIIMDVPPAYSTENKTLPNIEMDSVDGEALPVPGDSAFLGVSLLCNDADDTSYAIRLNEAMTKLEQTYDCFSSRQVDEDILIRAVMCGWDGAAKVHHLDIVWRFLRAMDEGLWYRANRVVRFANIWQIRCTMLHKFQPDSVERRTTALFMAPTEAQRAIPSRPPLVDYFVWPAVRNLILLEGIGKCSGKSTIAFAEHSQFSWPYEGRDVYKYNRTTNLYSLSEAFLQSWNDLSNHCIMQTDLVPYYIQPILAQVAEMPTVDAEINRVEECSSDDEEDHDDTTMHPISNGAPISNLKSTLPEISSLNWAVTDDESFNDFIEYPIDPFGFVRDAGPT